MIDVEQTIISQYGNSPILLQLINNFNQYIDQTANIEAFLSYVWDVSTAQGFGLDIWGRIVGVGRTLQVTTEPVTFGFNGGAGAQPFGKAPFYNGQVATNTYILTDDAFRTLILIKALSNISATTAPALNQLLQNMFADRGRCYVNDLGNMQMRFTFEFSLLPYEIAILTKSGALPRPAGVGATVLNIPLPGTFGFNTTNLSYSPFNNGTFLSQGEVDAI